MLVEDIRLDKCKELIYKISEDSIIRLYDAIHVCPLKVVGRFI